MPKATACRVCLDPLPGYDIESGAIKCSRCKWAERTKAPCADCGGPTGWPLTDKRKPDAPRCQPCRRRAIVHGTTYAYRKGCRCGECVEANRAAARDYRAKVMARDGVSLTTKYGHSGGAFIKRAERLAIYERDGWTCQLCGNPVDPRAPRNSWGEATLDHIEPQTHALIPDHRPENLRMAHRGCNASRGNRVAPAAA